jgi:hypothetical protein
MPATRRPSACRRSRRWPAARRSSCARAEGLAELADGACGLAVQHGTGPAFAEAIAALLAGDRPAQRRAARARAEANDWEQVLPGLLDHYRRLPRAPHGIASAGAGAGADDRGLVPAAGAMSNETTITPSRFESERFVCVVLHDVAPSTRAACMRPSPPSPRSPTCR